jgi:hypothetical protein
MRRNTGIMEDWNDGENKTTERACLVLLDPTFLHSSTPTFRNRLCDSPGFWLLATVVIPYTNYFKEV